MRIKQPIIRAGSMVVAVVAGACASAGAPAPDAPVTTTPPAAPGVTLSYLAPAAPATLTYQFADTTNSDIQAGPAGSIRVGIGNRGTAELRFEGSGTDQRVTVTMKEFAGQFSNSAGGGPMTASATDVKGAAMLTVTPTGVATITQRPEITPAFRQVAGSDNVYRRFFVRLPARRAQPGTVWTDTITSTESNEGMSSTTRNIVRSTYVRDSLVAGRTVAVIATEGNRTLEVTGTSQGVQIVQKVSGKVSGMILWDPQLNALVLRDEKADMSGTFDLPAMGMNGMPITATGRFVLRLVGP